MPKKRKVSTRSSEPSTTSKKKAKTISTADSAQIPLRAVKPPPIPAPVPKTKLTKKKSVTFAPTPTQISNDEDLFQFETDLQNDVDPSPSSFYSSSNNAASSTPVHQNLNKLFDHYRDSPKTEPDKVLINGAQKYLSDLSIALDEVVQFALYDLLTVTSVGEFERENFVQGWLNAFISSTTTSAPRAHPAQPLDTIQRQAAHVSNLRSRVQSDQAYFKTVYRSAFKLAKPENQRAVPMDSALEFWKVFFSSSSGGIEWNTKSTKWLDLWLEFYESQSKRPVNKDLWNMVGELVIKTKEPGGESLEWWSEDSAWPSAIDEFVPWVKEKRKAESRGDAMDVS